MYHICAGHGLVQVLVGLHGCLLPQCGTTTRTCHPGQKLRPTLFRKACKLVIVCQPVQALALSQVHSWNDFTSTFVAMDVGMLNDDW